MNDEQIIAMLMSRNEQAIEQLEVKYGRQLNAMAMRILSDEEDSRECVNDTYLKAWNTIPPTRPKHLSAYLHRIVRTISIDRLRRRKADKRKVSEYTTSLDELQECLSEKETPQDTLEMELLIQTIEAYLLQLSKQERQMFICRYHYLDSIKQIARCFDMSEAKIKTTLYRIRCGLRQHLEKEDFFL